MPNCSRRCVNSGSSVAASASCGGASKCTRREEQAGGVAGEHVAELLRVDDVAAGLEQQAGDRVHDARGVAGQGQDEFVPMGHEGLSRDARLLEAPCAFFRAWQHFPQRRLRRSAVPSLRQR